MPVTERTLRHAIVAVAAIALASGSAVTALANPVDVALVRDVQRTVNRYAFFTVFDDVSVAFDEDHEGRVTLYGSVTDPKKKRDLEKRVVAVDGIVDVRNEIEVLPVSTFDNELRYRVARAIYGNSAFWHYAARRHPPIHIVVNRGHVTLTGVVDTEADRALARVLAGQFGAFSVTNELTLPTTLGEALEAAAVSQEPRPRRPTARSVSQPQ